MILLDPWQKVVTLCRSLFLARRDRERCLVAHNLAPAEQHFRAQSHDPFHCSKWLKASRLPSATRSLVQRSRHARCNGKRFGPVPKSAAPMLLKSPVAAANLPSWANHQMRQSSVSIALAFIGSHVTTVSVLAVRTWHSTLVGQQQIALSILAAGGISCVDSGASQQQCHRICRPAIVL